MCRLVLTLMNKKRSGGSVTRQEKNVKENGNFIGRNKPFLQNSVKSTYLWLQKINWKGTARQTWADPFMEKVVTELLLEGGF
jgi:hypothetical protein